MKRFRVPEIVLGVFIGIVLASFGAGIGSYQTQQCEQAKHTQANAPKFDHEVPASQQKPDGQHQVSQQPKHAPYFGCGALGLIPSAIGFMDTHEGFFVGGFTLALFLATILLWLAGERQMDLIAANSAQQSRDMKASIGVAQRAADAAVTTHRPWIKIIALQPVSDFEERAGKSQSAGGTFNLSFVNVGATPAVGIHCWVEIGIGTYGIETAKSKMLKVPQFTGMTAFPNDPGTLNRYTNAPLADLRNPDETRRFVTSDKRQRITTYLVARIDYEFPGGAGRSEKTYLLRSAGQGGLLVDVMPVAMPTLDVREMAGCTIAT